MTSDPMADAAMRVLVRGKWWRIKDGQVETSTEHPFPPTLDAAHASFPPDVIWNRGEKVLVASRRMRVWWAESPTGKTVGLCNDEGDAVRELYSISLQSWEQQ